MKKIRMGIYGGSFNPIHNGHTQLGEWLCKEGCVDELWFLVSPLNPLKAGQTDLESDETRLRLAHLAVEESERLGVSDLIWANAWCTYEPSATHLTEPAVLRLP